MEVWVLDLRVSVLEQGMPSKMAVKMENYYRPPWVFVNLGNPQNHPVLSGAVQLSNHPCLAGPSIPKTTITPTYTNHQEVPVPECNLTMTSMMTPNLQQFTHAAPSSRTDLQRSHGDPRHHRLPEQSGLGPGRGPGSHGCRQGEGRDSPNGGVGLGGMDGRSVLKPWKTSHSFCCFFLWH